MTITYTKHALARMHERGISRNEVEATLANPTQRIAASHGRVESRGFIQRVELRVQLMNHVRKVVQNEGWTQAQAAEHLGVAQSRVSDLLTGKSDKFSLDMLISLASRVGCKVGLAIESD